MEYLMQETHQTHELGQTSHQPSSINIQNELSEIL